MSKHNYSQYSNNNNKKKHNHTETTVTEETVTTMIAPENEPALEIKMEQPSETVAPVIVNETAETASLPKTVTGTVANCAKLNVRAKPNTDAAVVCVLNAAAEVVINVDRSNNEWFCVCTSTGVKGYCMRKFVNARL